MLKDLKSIPSSLLIIFPQFLSAKESLITSIHSRITGITGVNLFFLPGAQTNSNELNIIGNPLARLTENKRNINNSTVAEGVEFNKGN
jgi:hypothetical protein